MPLKKSKQALCDSLYTFRFSYGICTCYEDEIIDRYNFTCTTCTGSTQTLLENESRITFIVVCIFLHCQIQGRKKAFKIAFLLFKRAGFQNNSKVVTTLPFKANQANPWKVFILKAANLYFLFGKQDVFGTELRINSNRRGEENRAHSYSSFCTMVCHLILCSELLSEWCVCVGFKIEVSQEIACLGL